MRTLCTILIGLFAAGEISAESPAPEGLPDKNDPAVLATLPPMEALRRYRQRGWTKAPSPYLARNAAMGEWLPVYFKETPVLFENMDERSEIIRILSELPAEWAVRFLVELSLDDRPMKSTRYDYDDPAFIKKMEEYEEGIGDTDDTGDIIYKLYGYKAPGDNRALVGWMLNQTKLSGAPDLEERRAQGISVAGWLRLPQQSGRIPEIVRETWGERAVLNADIGLGPDNKPLVPTGLAPPGTRPRKAGSIAADEAGVPAEASGGPAAVKWIPLALASGLLALALAVVARKRAKRPAGP